jgi:hypothetical protein
MSGQILANLIETIEKNAEVVMSDSPGNTAYLSVAKFDPVVESVKKSFNPECAGCCNCRADREALALLEGLPRGYIIGTSADSSKFIPKDEFAQIKASLEEYQRWLAAQPAKE